MKKLSFLIALFLSAQLHAQVIQKYVPQLLQDLNPGSGNGAMSFQTRYFLAGQETDDNYEPWQVFGVGTGIVKLTDINPAGSSLPDFFSVDFGFYSATGPSTGRELYTYNNFFDIIPGPEGSNPREYTEVYGGGNFLTGELAGAGGAHRVMYKQDGASGFTPVSTAPWSDGEMYPVVVRGGVYFAADNTVAPTGNELWVTDGTAAWTKVIKDINPGSAGSYPKYLTNLDDNFIIFSADDGTNGRELYISNRTEQGTLLLKDINSGTGSSNAHGFKKLDNNTILFFADDGVHGMEPWITDGTDTGTKMLMDINPGFASSVVNGSYLGESHFMYPQYLVADDGIHGSELWEFIPSISDVHMVMDINPGIAPGVTDLCHMSYISTEGLFFAGDDGVHGREPWVYGWSSIIPEMLKDINPGPDSSMFKEGNGFAMSDTSIYFVANDGISGYEVWVMRAVTAVNDVQKANSIKIYPNPTTGLVTIRTHGKILQVEVYNAIGQLVMNNELSNNTINLQNQPDGVYYIKLKEEGSAVSTQKIVLAR